MHSEPMLQLIQILEKTISPNRKELRAAQWYLDEAAATNFTTFIKMLSDVLAQGGKSQVARLAAGLQLKNHLTSKHVPLKQQYQQRWLALPEETRQYIKKNIGNLEDLLKEKDNQVDIARARLNAMQAHHCSSEGALSSLEEVIGDKEKQIQQLREQRDRTEHEKNEEREHHEREIADYNMKLHALESEVEKLGARLERA